MFMEMSALDSQDIKFNRLTVNDDGETVADTGDTAADNPVPARGKVQMNIIDYEMSADAGVDSADKLPTVRNDANNTDVQMNVTDYQLPTDGEESPETVEEQPTVRADGGDVEVSVTDYRYPAAQEIVQDDSADDFVDEEPVVRVNRSVATATVYDWLGSLFSALVVVLLLMTFGFRIIDVDGRSMEPTLIDTDKVVITNLFYTPHQGDIVIISHAEEYSKPLVKRVIATAGQQLRLDYENNAVYVDGQKLDEPYIQGMTIPGDIPEAELNTVVPEGKVFVMGDNRSVSLDSRYRQIGYIDESSIIGKAQLDIIPHKYDGTSLKFDISGIRYVYK